MPKKIPPEYLCCICNEEEVEEEREVCEFCEMYETEDLGGVSDGMGNIFSDADPGL